MRLAIIDNHGSPALAVVRNHKIGLLPKMLLRGSEDLTAIISGGRESLATIADAAARLAGSDWRSTKDVTFRLPIERPGKVLCLGLNYIDHAKEGGYQIPEYPALFIRAATSLIPAGAPMIRPRVSEKFDYEAELMVVFGRKGRYIAEIDALDYVFGYTCFNDGSVRDYQRKTHQWTPGKNFDGTGAIGPVVVTADELPPGANGLNIACRLAGQTVQSANTSDMIVSVAKAIATLSEFTTLEPGDLIAMGTPQGVGHARQPPLWMRPGDMVEIDIEKIGLLSNTVADEDVRDGAVST